MIKKENSSRTFTCSLFLVSLTEKLICFGEFNMKMCRGAFKMFLKNNPYRILGEEWMPLLQRWGMMACLICHSHIPRWQWWSHHNDEWCFCETFCWVESRGGKIEEFFRAKRNITEGRFNVHDYAHTPAPTHTHTHIENLMVQCHCQSFGGCQFPARLCTLCWQLISCAHTHAGSGLSPLTEGGPE